MYEKAIQIGSKLPAPNATNRELITSLLNQLIEAAKGLAKSDETQYQKMKGFALQFVEKLFKTKPTVQNFNKFEDTVIIFNEKDKWDTVYAVDILEWFLKTHSNINMEQTTEVPDVFRIGMGLLIRFSHLQKASEVLTEHINKNKNRERICTQLFEFTFNMLAKYRIEESAIHTNFKTSFLSYGTYIISTSWSVSMESSRYNFMVQSNTNSYILNSYDPFWSRMNPSLHFENDAVLKYALPLCPDFCLWFQKQKISKLNQTNFNPSSYPNVIFILCKIKKSMELFGNKPEEWTKYLQEFLNRHKGKKALHVAVRNNLDITSPYQVRNKKKLAQDIQNLYALKHPQSIASPSSSESTNTVTIGNKIVKVKTQPHDNTPSKK
jgi:hypothetical protein